MEILLGKANNTNHIQILEDIAYWLDQNKFSCTFSIIEGIAIFDIEPYPDDIHHYEGSEFKEHALEIIINQLNKAIDNV